ncbi:MAG TPA: hypothetical protein VHZ99_07170 [Steroidobacteraceae bacterium]|jgi:hypothetical protein|nr:hypothetical protein [Steroidobacteraceae bacterium]
MTGSKAPRRGQSVNELLGTAVSIFRATLLKCLPLAMIGVLCASVPNFYLRATGTVVEPGMKMPTEPTYWGLMALAVVGTLYIFSAMMLRQLYCSGGFAVEARQELVVAARRLPTLVVSWVLMQASLALGFLLILPGIFLLVCYLVLLPVILLEGQHNPLLALRRCIMLVKDNWWRICTSFVIALLGTLVCFLAFSAFMAILHELLGGLGQAFEAIFAAAMVAAFAMAFVFYSALALVIHSSASNSA